jgi:hypothetical protein
MERCRHPHPLSQTELYDAGQRPQRFPHWSSPSQGNYSEPSPYNNVNNTPSSFFASDKWWHDGSLARMESKLSRIRRRSPSARGGWTEGHPREGGPRWGRVAIWRSSVHLHGGHSWILHKMDTSETTHQCQLYFNQEILLANIIYRYVILRQCNVQRFLQADGNKGLRRISISPTIKQGCREGQLFNLRSNQEDTGGRNERKMGGGHANRNVVPQHHSVQGNKFHTLSINVWSWSSFTRGDKTSKTVNHNRSHRMPKRRGGWRLARVR